MNAFNHEPAALCEATRQLTQAAYELRLQRGTGVIDLGKLERLLTVAPEHHVEHTLADVVPITRVKTSSSPLNLDPHEAYYRPPYTGHVA